MAKKVEVTRVFDAPVEMVWNLWVDPNLVMQWWGPAKFTSPSAVIDFRVGGKSILCMHAPKDFGGKDSYSLFEYKKIIPYERIEVVQNLCDPSGTKQPPLDLGMPADFPTDIFMEVIFKQLSSNKTEMTVIEHAEFGSMSHFAQLGLEQSLDKIFGIFPN